MTHMSGFSMPPRDELKWLAVDLDGTLAEPLWTASNPTSNVGDPIERNVDKLRQAQAAGYGIVIHTSRSWEAYEIIESWLIKHDIPFKGIVCGKLLAAAYIDDRAISADAPSWIPGHPSMNDEDIYVIEEPCSP